MFDNRHFQSQSFAGSFKPDSFQDCFWKCEFDSGVLFLNTNAPEDFVQLFATAV